MNTPRDDDERHRLIRALADDGCLLCRDKDAAEHHWHTWYVMETHRDPGYRRRIAAAGGFCARHLRLLTTTSEGIRVLPSLLGDLIASALTGVTGCHCDPCGKMTAAVDRRLGALVRWLDDPEVINGIRRLCTHHLLDVLNTAPWPFATTLAAIARDQPYTPPSDPDLLIRAPHLTAAAELFAQDDKRLTEQSTTDRATHALDLPCCPVCRARSRGELRYATWLLGQDVARLDPGEPWLCPTHLADATLLDHDSACTIWATMHQAEHARLAQLADRLDASPLPGFFARLRAAWPHLLERRRDRAAAAFRRPERFVAEALRNFRDNQPSCTACAAGDLAERRELALLDAASLHHTVRERWTRGHGLCRDHAALAASDLAKDVLRSRLTLLGWELEETQRKHAWHTRHEPATPAETSWPRAIPFLRGDACLGLAPAEFDDQDTP